MRLVVGVDAGGTASRAVVADANGEVIARAAAGPGNPVAQGPAAAVHIGAAIRAALDGHDPRHVDAAVVGLAGISALFDPALTEAFAREWKAIGLTCDVEVVGDAVTAFAAGTSAPAGAVLIAGTGAVAALVDNGRIVRTADGLGWLLGDFGSGLWLGLEAVRAIARAWPPASQIATGVQSGSAHLEGLAARIAAYAAVGSRDELVYWAGRVPPASFAALAPLVCAAAEGGDPLAERLVADAADRLVATLDELAAPPGPVVLGGGLLAARTPVGALVLSVLRGRGMEVHVAHDPAAGAARLAARGSLP
ncbi:MAG TPA: BadF/BadG/BcrA/BcrD ATPase family protein [Actinoplanes sp.]|nr:BadF/BadG/BcrA/BcrD ATPase family protein [Actinoplanes sp.]